MDTYIVGNSSQQVKLALDVDTFGMAASRAFVDNGPNGDPNLVGINWGLGTERISLPDNN